MDNSSFGCPNTNIDIYIKSNKSLSFHQLPGEALRQTVEC